MSSAQIAALGAIAGFTIFLGLPIGRLREPMPKLRALLSATATGILIFLLWDVLDHAWEPVDAALSDHRYGSALGNGIVLAARASASAWPAWSTSTGGSPGAARDRSARARRRWRNWSPS